MSATNTLTEADILREIEQSLEPSKAPKVKIGQNEVPLDNPQALQTAIDAALQNNRSEFESLRSTVEQLQKGRTIEPDVTEKPPVVTAPPTTPRTPKRPPTNEEWTKEFVQDPQRVLDETIGRLLGVDSLGSEALRGIFNGVGTELQKQQAVSQLLLEQQQKLDTRLTESLAVREAQAFIDTTPEYEISDKNKQVMQSYLEEYQLPATQKNLKLVYNQAKLDGKIAAPAEQHQQTFQQAPLLRQGMPRIGNQGAPPSLDEQHLLKRANEMPLEDMANLIDRLKHGQFSR